MATSGGGGGTMAADLGISVVGVGGMRVSIRDLIHPSLNDSLKGQQQVTFKLVKTGQFHLWNNTGLPDYLRTLRRVEPTYFARWKRVSQWAFWFQNIFNVKSNNFNEKSKATYVIKLNVKIEGRKYVFILKSESRFMWSPSQSSAANSYQII